MNQSCRWTRLPQLYTYKIGAGKLSACPRELYRNFSKGRFPTKTHVTGAELENVLAPMEQGFRPVLDPSIAVAAVIASLPPILFWIRIASNEMRRRKEVEMKEQQRQVMPRALRM